MERDGGILSECVQEVIAWDRSHSKASFALFSAVGLPAASPDP